MALLRKCNIPKPAVRKEAVEVPELGGEVVVRGTMLDERLALVFGVAPQAPAAEADGAGAEAAPAPPAALEQDDPRERYQHIARLLAYAVVDADGKPVFTVDEWAEFGGQHFAATLKLYNIAKRLSGMVPEEAKKNS